MNPARDHQHRSGGIRNQRKIRGQTRINSDDTIAVQCGERQIVSYTGSVIDAGAIDQGVEMLDPFFSPVAVVQRRAHASIYAPSNRAARKLIRPLGITNDLLILRRRPGTMGIPCFWRSSFELKADIVQNLRYVITEYSIILGRPQQPCVGGPNDFPEIAELHNAAEGGF